MNLIIELKRIILVRYYSSVQFGLVRSKLRILIIVLKYLLKL